VDERTQGALLLALGGIALRLGLTDAALAYVKPSLQPPLAAAGLTLAVLGVVAVRRAFRSERHGGDAGGHPGAPDPAHQHAHGGPGIAWLLVLPLLSLLLVAPPPLGAFAAARQSDLIPVDTRSSYGPLPGPVDGAVPLSLVEFVYRALYDGDRSLEGERVRLTGFVSDADVPGGYQLSRFTVSCCAADARAVDVVLVDGQPAPPVDTWLEVEGTWRPGETVAPGEATTQPPVLEVATRRSVEAPAEPYEY
jgi:uncharacterized repeat protein (TIGR03943 family)